MFFLPLTTALAAPTLAELPAALASTRDWDERTALVEAAQSDASDDDRAALDALAQLLVTLRRTQPGIDRGDMRSLTLAVVSDDPVWAAQAQVAAELARPLPSRQDDSPFYTALPTPPEDGTLLVTGDPTAVQAVKELAGALGWTVADGDLALTVDAPVPAQWGDRLGYAVQLTGEQGGTRWTVDGFASGPLSAAVVSAATRSAASNLLSSARDAPVLLPRVDAGRACFYRRPDNAGLPLQVVVAGQTLEMPAASHGCVDVAAGSELKGPMDKLQLAKGDSLWELSDRGTTPDRYRILPGDPDMVEKLLGKGKVTAWSPTGLPGD